MLPNLKKIEAEADERFAKEIATSHDVVRKAGFATNAKIAALLGLNDWFEAEKHRGRNFSDTVSNVFLCFLNGIVRVTAKVNNDIELTDPVYACNKSCSNCPLTKLV